MVARDLFLGCLNPYCSGRWSRTVMTLGDNVQLNGLNPYCSGRWSRTKGSGLYKRNVSAS